VTSVANQSRTNLPSDASNAPLSDGGVFHRPADDGLKGMVERTSARVLRTWPAIVLFVLLFGGWEYIVQSRNIPPLYIPAPSEIYSEVAGNLGFFWENTLLTLQEAGLGLLIGSAIACVAAALMAEFSIADRGLLPAFVVIKVVPSVTLVPVLIVALGFGIWPKVIVAALTLFYAVFINAVTGFKSVDEGAMEVMRSVNASRREIFFRLRLPNSLPYLFAAAKIGFPLAVLGALFAELDTSKAGLGNVIAVAASRINMQTMWGAIFVLMFIGVVLVGSVGIMEKRMLKWHSSQREL
jgi:NitT/TauT family transport system permease protein